jgi:hypothetical protein
MSRHQFFKKFKSACGKLIYMSNGEFSLTRIFMVVTFTFSILLIPTGIILSLLGKTIPKEIYDYSFKLSGGGIVQYGLTKIVGEFSARRSDSTSMQTQPRQSQAASATSDSGGVV